MQRAVASASRVPDLRRKSESIHNLEFLCVLLLQTIMMCCYSLKNMFCVLDPFFLFRFPRSVWQDTSPHWAKASSFSARWHRVCQLYLVLFISCDSSLISVHNSNLLAVCYLITVSFASWSVSSFLVRFMLQHGGRALLADEMGLGKTLQASGFLSHIIQYILSFLYKNLTLIHRGQICTINC